MSTPNNVTVVIRSVGERTEGVCYHLLAQQVPENKIVVINEAPFTAAIAKTFEVGLERGLPWTLVVDADVLVRDGAVSSLLALAQQADENLFIIQGKVLDKFFGGSRGGGARVYRTNILSQALKHVPTEGVSLRPESYVMRQMAVLGYSHVQKDLLLGLHDYEQYFRDIYRKAFVHAHKHNRHLIYLQPMWRHLAESDPDLQMALWGLHDGLAFDGAVNIDVRQFSQEAFDRVLEKQGWQEKNDLLPTALPHSKIEDIINTFVPPQEYWLGWYLKDLSNGPWRTRLRTVLSHVGRKATASWLVHANWLRAKRKLHAWSRRQ